MLRKECGIDVVSITEQLSDDPTSILIEALLEAMDEYYSINLAQEVKRGMNEKFSRGGVVSAPPFGYRMGESCFEIDEMRAPIVQGMFTQFSEGMSCSQIAGWLNDRGIRTIRGKCFEKRSVKYILMNPVYTGNLRRRTGKMDEYDRYYQKERVQIVKGEHLPIVSEELFEKVQGKLQNER